MKHLCIDARMTQSGGTRTFLNYVCSYLLKIKSYKLTFLCRKENSFPHEGVSNIVMSSPHFSLKEQFELAKKIPPCDLLWSPFINIPLLPIKAKKRLVTVYDTYHLTHSKMFPYFHRLGTQVFYNGSFLLADCIVTLSKFSEGEILKRGIVKPKNVRVIPGGIDSDFFSPCTNKKELSGVQARYGLPSKFLLALGNVRPHKNLSTLLLAFEKLDRAMPGEYSLVIVGKEQGYKTFDNHLLSLLDLKSHLKGRVIFTGEVSIKDIPPLYSLASCFCFPSLYEGYGYPPLEAMACECPVVASTAGSIPEVCEDGALYIDPCDANDLFQKIRKVLLNENVRKNLILKGRGVVERRKIIHCQEKFQELLEDIV